MRIFFTRHGQVFSAKYYNGDASRPIGNTALSELGKRQALLVGKRLKQLGFNGIILSSPYDRTLETAQIIAEQVNTSFSPLACLHEIFVAYEPPATFNGLTLADILKKYNRAKQLFPLDYPWWENKTEDLFDVIERVKNGLAHVLSQLDKEQDVLLVGHAATAVALRHIFKVTNVKGFHWNCHLSLLYNSEGASYACDSEHFDSEEKTGNAILFTDHNNKWRQNEATMSAFNDKNTKNIVLHIGDTQSANYGYYQRLIALVQPSVIIHTGDLVDEIKAGRIEGAREYWKTSAPQILNIMKASGARVIVVPGNNDLLPDLQVVEGIEIVSPKTVLRFGDTSVYLTHRVLDISDDAMADVYLYGHGQTGETRTPNDNVRNGKRYFNAVWGASVHNFDDDKHVILPECYV